MRLRTFFWVVTWLLVLAVFGILLGLRSYRVFTQEQLVAVVQCEPAPRGSPQHFLLRIVPYDDALARPVQQFPMYGDQWSIGGDILKWHPWLNLLGVKTCHKLTRLSSRYLDPAAERGGPRSVYELNGGVGPFWRALYWLGSWIPFVEAVYGNAAYVMARPGTRWGVYVTLSGYLVKPLLPVRNRP